MRQYHKKTFMKWPRRAKPAGSNARSTTFRRVIRHEQLEQRRLLATFQNPYLPLDVNGSGLVEPIDALYLVNELNVNGSRSVDELPEDAPFFDTSGDDFVSPIDVLLVVNLLNFDASPPEVVAGLAKDTAPFNTTNQDRITSDPNLEGSVFDPSGVLRLEARVNGGTLSEIDVAFDGSFDWQPPLAFDGTDDGAVAIDLFATDAAGNRSGPTRVQLTLDTQGPGQLAADLSPGSDSEPIGDQSTEARFVNLQGQTDVGSIVMIDGEVVEVDAQGNFFSLGQELASQERTFDIFSYDPAGNATTSQLIISREAPNGSSFSDAAGYASEMDETVPLSLSAGTRTLTLDLGLDFGEQPADGVADDVFSLYLIDTDGQTLIDQGVPGTPLLSISGSTTELATGLVRFDGRLATIDVSSAGVSSGWLRYQWIDRDGMSDASALIELTDNVVDPYSEPLLQIPSQFAITTAGETIDAPAEYATTSDLLVETRRTRFDSATGRLLTEVRVRNTGTAVGRRVLLSFPDTPEAVSLLNASGVTSDGTPYLNLVNTIEFGGLGRGQASAWLELEFEVAENTPWAWQPSVMSAGPNAAPIWQSLDPIVVAVGSNSVWDLPVSDADGEPINISVRGPDNSPPIQIEPGKKLRVSPRPGDEGTYQYTLIASDGAESSTLELEIHVVPDALQTTRVSGQVLDVDGSALDGVPLQLGRHQATTDSEGTFQIEIPSFLVPTPRFDVHVPAGDPAFDPMARGDRVIEMQRLGYLPGTGTSENNPRQHPNLISAFLDGSVVYGSATERAAALRTSDGTGKLKLGSDGLLPRNSAEFFPDGMLENENNSQRDPATMYVAGDVRVSENPGLTALHTIFVREHNRRAEQMASEHPDWTGDQLYQHARRWNAALLQSITYNEFLPVMLGGGALPSYSGYDPSVNAQVSGLFNGAAFRVGHSMSPADVWRLAEDGNSLEGGPISLRDAFFNPELLATDGLEPYLRGLMAQPVEEVDTLVRDELRNFLFGPPGAGGLDLAAINIQRGRDIGLPSYNQARIDMGLKAVESFAEITADAEMQATLEAVYGSVEQIDVWVGGLAEDHETGAMVGPLFAEILRDGFVRLRDGDRYWFENGRLTQTELDELRATNWADVLLRNTELNDIPGSPFTSGLPGAGPGPGGSAAGQTPGAFPTLSGLGNNVEQPNWGAAGSAMLVDYQLGYADGISQPAGSERPSAREISNQLMAQSAATENAAGATAMLMIWGQLVAHDMTLSASGMEDTLLVFGDAREGAEAYPFVAEKIPDLLGHDAFYGSDNEMGRPIFLPQLNNENAVTIDPAQDTLVSVSVDPDLPNVELFVKAGTLRTREGELYDGSLSITAVDPSRTPAALPNNLQTGLIITVQPAGLVFSEPAPITFPNTSQLLPGDSAEYWQVNPDTAQFEPVAEMAVSGDGSVLSTVSGGLLTTSWGGGSPTPPTSDGTANSPYNKKPGCPGKCGKEAGSLVEHYTGAYREWHDLASYQSQGVTRGLRLNYNSLHADPRHTVHFQLDNARAGWAFGFGTSHRGFVDSGEKVALGGYQRDPERGNRDQIPQGHYWRIPDTPSDILAGILVDYTDAESGLYLTDLNYGTGFAGTFGLENNGSVDMLIRTTDFDLIEPVEMVVVNRRNSPFGAGWSMDGLTELVVHEGVQDLLRPGREFLSVVLIDGNQDLLFHWEDGRFVSPSGDFSTLTYNDATQRFQRELVDGTLYRFDAKHRVESITDRNGNQTQFFYDEDLIERIVDPVGLETRFESQSGRIHKVVDPAGRETRFEYDSIGNLTRITDPDASFRQFDYDGDHRLTDEINQRGDHERTFYSSIGRVERVVRADGSEMEFAPMAAHGVLPTHLTSSPWTKAEAAPVPVPETAITDAAGRLERIGFNQSGLVTSLLGPDGETLQLTRNAQNLVTTIRDARGNLTNLSYDSNGNPIETSDSFAGGVTGGAEFFDRVIRGSNFLSDAQTFTAAGDLNADGIDDFVMATFNNRPATMAAEFHVYLGSGVGTFRRTAAFSRPISPTQLELGDLDQDGSLDLVAADSSGLTFYQGMGDGTFRFASIQSLGESISMAGALRVGDVNGDSINDLIYRGSSDQNYFVSMLGDGNFGFSVASRVALPAGNHSEFNNTVRLADIDQDGDLDAAIALGGVQTSSYDPGTVSGIAILTNDSSGQFQLAETLQVGVQGVVSQGWNRRHPAGIPNINFGDLNGDGWVDLVAAGSSSFGVYSLLNDGQGSFLEPIDTTLDDPNSGSARSLPSSVELVDINDDGNLDAVVSAARNLGDRGVNYAGYGKQMFVMLGNGDGTFDSEHTNVTPLSVPRETTLIKLHDDQPAIIVSETIRLMRSEIIPLTMTMDGIAFEQKAVPVEGGSTREIVDVDGDGDLDIVWAELRDVDRNAQTWTLNVWSQSVHSGAGGRQLIESYAGTGFLYATSETHVYVDHFDHDGRVDIMVAVEQEEIRALWSTEVPGQFDPSTLVYNSGGRPFELLDPVDFDADGRVDLIVYDNIYSSSDSQGPPIYLLRNSGERGFDSQTLWDYSNLTRVQDVTVGDVDGDEILDLIVAFRPHDDFLKQVHFFPGDGLGGIEAASEILIPAPDNFPDPAHVAAADVDGDGRDEVIHNAGGRQWSPHGRLSVWEWDNGQWAEEPLYARSTRFHPTIFDLEGDLRIADLNRDGSPDIVISGKQQAGQHAVGYVLNDGLGGFGPLIRLELADSSEKILDVQVVDVLGDALPEIVVSQASHVTFFENFGGHAAGLPARMAYDEQFGLITYDTDELGRETYFVRNESNGNLLHEIRVVGTRDASPGSDDDVVTSFTYTASGMVESITDPLNRVTEFLYDQYDRLVRSTYAVGTADQVSVSYAYDPSTIAGRAGLVTSLTDERGGVTEYKYDAMNRLVRIIEPDPDGPEQPLTSPVTVMHYDPAGNLTRMIDAASVTTETTYDPLDRPTRITDPSGTVKQRYDKAGNLIAVVDPLGNVSQYEYDSRDRLTKMIDAEGGVTKYGYDFDSNLVSLTDPVGNTTRFFYDERSRLIREIDPLGNAIRYEYDAADNLIKKTDRNERVTTYEYDELDRLVKENWGADGNEIQYRYDKTGNLRAIDDFFSGLEFEYDNLDRNTRIDNDDTLDAPHVVLDYAYDEVGNVVSVTDSIFDQLDAITGGATNVYEYDALHRLTRLSQVGQSATEKRVDFAYNQLGQFTQIQRFSDLAGTQSVVSTSYQYDTANRLKDLRHRNNMEDVAFYEYTFDSSSRITSINSRTGLVQFSYDDTSQLTAANYANPTRTDETYAYDENGNRLSSHLHGEGYITDKANRLLSDGTYTYDYDREGNLIRRTKIATSDYRVFIWDHRNRLVSITDHLANGSSTQVVEFTYDAFDRRIAKSVDTTPDDGIDGVTTHFVYDREDVLLDFVDLDGAGGEEPVLEQRYLHGPGIDQVLAQENGSGEVHWLMTDHLGTVKELVTNDGRVVNEIRYDSFGNIVERSNPQVGTRYAFQSRELDQETGLHYFRARYYDATMGRFVSEDPIGFASAESNTATFARNTPTSSVDPLGLTANSIVNEAKRRAKSNKNAPVEGPKGGTECWDLVYRVLEKGGAKPPTLFYGREGEVDRRYEFGWPRGARITPTNPKAHGGIDPGNILGFDPGTRFVNPRNGRWLEFGDAAKNVPHSGIIESVKRLSNGKTMVTLINQGISGVRGVTRSKFIVENITSGGIQSYIPDPK